MDLQSISERLSGFHVALLHIRHKTSAVFPGPKRFIRESTLYPPLNCTWDLDESIKYAALAEIPAQYNYYPLVKKERWLLFTLFCTVILVFSDTCCLTRSAEALLAV